MKSKIICNRFDLIGIKLLAKIKRVHIEIYGVEILNFWDYIRIGETVPGATVKMSDRVVVCESKDLNKLMPFVRLF